VILTNAGIPDRFVYLRTILKSFYYLCFSGRRRNDGCQETETADSPNNVVVVARQEVKGKQRRQTSTHQESDRQDPHRQERALRIQGRVGPGGQHSDGETHPALGLEENRRIHRRAGAHPFRFHLHKSVGRIDAEGRLGGRSNGLGRRGGGLCRQTLEASHLRN